MGHSTASGRAGGQRAEDTVKKAFASLNTPSGYLGDEGIGRVAEVIERLGPEYRIEVSNDNNTTTVAYERSDWGGEEWIRNVRSTSPYAIRSRGTASVMDNTRQMVADILQGGVLAHPGRLKVVRRT